MLPKKKLNRKRNFSTMKKSINKYLSFMQYKKGSKKYEEMDNNIKKAGLDITPETYQTITILMPTIISLVYIAFKILNYVNFMASTEEIKKVAEILQDPSLLNVKLNIRFLYLLMVWVITFLVIKSIPKIKISFRQAASEKETMILQTYTIMMLKTEKPTKEILKSLYERANIFRPYLQRAISKFSTDHNNALTELKNTVPNNNFKKICIALEQLLNNDKKLSLTYLENHRVLMREINKQKRMRKGTKDQIIGMLLMILPMLVFISIIGYPILIYTIKSIKTIPI